MSRGRCDFVRAGAVLLLFGMFGTMAEAIVFPAAPGPFSECAVVNYKDEGGEAPAGKRRLLGATNPLSAADAVRTQTWIVRSASATNVTYAVKQTLLGSGAVELCSYTPNRVLATLEKGKSEAAFRAAMTAKGLTVKYELMKDSNGNSVFVVEAEDTENDVVETMTASIQSTGFCGEKIYRNTVYSVCSSPNDTAWSDQWNMVKIGAPEAWDATTDASGVTVAVLDTGINYNHYDLNENLWTNPGEVDRGSNGSDDDGNGIVDDIYGMQCIGGNIGGNPMDDLGHGSHCAGIIGAVGNNMLGVAGVAWSAKIMALKFCDSSGNGSLEDVIRCLNYAEDKGARVVNCSWITKGQWDDLLGERIKSLGNKGVIFVCAAGNASKGESPVDLDNEGPPTYPACFTYSNIVSVAATDADDKLASFSFWGERAVDIAAPGENIYSTVLGGMGFKNDSGTSMAAPHVTGALALLMAYYPDESSYALVQKLYDCGEPLESLRGYVKTGKRLSLKGLFGLRAPSGADVTASLGTSSEAVSIYWNAVTGATFYRVWRAESADGEKTMLRDWHAGLTFNDTTSDPEKQYYYFIQAASSSTGASASPFSSGVIGYRAAASTAVKVTFDAAGGNVATTSASFELGETYGELPTPTCVGKVFLGWYTEATGGTRIDASCAVRAEVTGLFAHWIADNAPRIENLFARQRYPWNGSVDISFTLAGLEDNYAADVSLSARSSDGKTSLPLTSWIGEGPGNLLNGMHKFVWNSVPDVGNTLSTNISLVATLTTRALKPGSPTSVTAQSGASTTGTTISWGAVDGATGYDIYRSTANDPASAQLLDSTSSTSYTDATGTPGLPYYYWVVASNAAGKSDFSSSVVGYRKKVPVALTISGDMAVAAGGTASYAASVRYNDDSSTLVTPTWSLSSGSSYGTISASGVFMANGTATQRNVTIAASYTEAGETVSDAKAITVTTVSVTVTFDGNGGTPSESSKTYTVYGAYGALSTAFRLGYTFTGWYTAGGVRITEASTVAADVTALHAQWTGNSYMIAFDANGGSGVMTPIAMVYGVSKSLPANAFIRSGYVFGGWATTATGTVLYRDGASVKNLMADSEATVTLYAVWNVDPTDPVCAPYYDLREEGRVMPVKSCSPYGTSWAFDVLASVESTWLSESGESIDLSPNNMANLAGFDYGFNDGGNATMAMAYLLRWDGPVLESQDPYPDEGGSSRIAPVLHVQNVHYVAAKKSDLDHGHLKRAIVEWGAVYAHDRWSSASYSSTHGSYYSAQEDVYGGMGSCTIVGWDDNYPKENFVVQPPGNGAYIVRKSWGQDWGDDGYMYVSYYDATLAWNDMYVFCAEPTSNYDGIYQHDELGHVQSLRSGGDANLAANVFYAVAQETLSAVGVYVLGANADYKISIYTGGTTNGPASGMKVHDQDVHFNTAGYFTVPLEREVALERGMRFSVVVQMSVPDVAYPIAIESAYSGYSSSATASSGQSYSITGNGTWSDISANGWNFCCKAYTKNRGILHEPPSAPVGVTVSTGSSTDGTVISWADGGGGIIYYVYRNTSNNSSTATLLGSTAATSYYDTTGTEGISYYYWVKAYNDGGYSDLSAGAVGYRKLSAPTNVSATDGTSTSGTTISWSSVSGATKYYVYRYTSNSSSSATSIGNTTATSYTDTSGTAGTTYYYWVKAYSSSSASYSAFSSSDSGYRKKEISLATALDNTSQSFTTGGDSPYWHGQSSKTADGTDAARSGAISDNQKTWFETTVSGSGTLTFKWFVSSESGWDYLEYLVDGTVVTSISGTDMTSWETVTKAISGSGTHTIRWQYRKDSSRSSGDDAGFVDQVTWTAGAVTLSAPTNVSATDGTSSTGVTVSWSSVSGATEYNVYRGTSSSSSAASHIATVTKTSCTDTSATAGTTYYYWVKAFNSSNGASSSFSSYDTGYRKSTVSAPATPTGFRYDSSGGCLYWNASFGATGYNIYRSSTSGGTYTKVATVTSVPTWGWTDSSYRGMIGFYRVTAYNDGGESARSDYVVAMFH